MLDNKNRIYIYGAVSLIPPLLYYSLSWECCHSYKLYFESIYIIPYFVANSISKALFGVGAWGGNNLWNGGRFAFVHLLVCMLQGIIILLLVDAIAKFARKRVQVGRSS